MQRTIIMVGAFPPPVHGLAVINQAMSELLESLGRRVTTVDMSATSLERGARYHLRRIERAVRGAARVAAQPTSNTGMYMSLSGGFGQAYDLLHVAVARLKRLDLTIHHHSFAYLTRPRTLTRILFAVAPARTRHVVLSPAMERALRARYGVSNTGVVSNTAFISDVAVEPPIARPLSKLGFLGNISAEKGIFDFIALVQAARAAHLDVEGVIAGPFQDVQTETNVKRLVDGLPFIRYVGPQYGAAKAAFFRGIDVLVFPTRYANEAEPITIHEALMHGVPVIAYGRGAIPEILDGLHGAVISPDDDFVSRALRYVTEWTRDAEGRFATMRITAQRRFQAARTEALQSLGTLLERV